MKHLFFVAVAIGIFSGTPIFVKAQTNVNIERVEGKGRPEVFLKFIEGIEVTAGATSSSTVESIQETRSGASGISIAPVVNTGFNSNIELSSSLQFKYALLMECEVEKITNLSLFKFIDDWWGTRYRYGGSDRNGIDCSAFTGKLALEVYGITLPRIARDQLGICEKLAMADIAEGDLVFFNTRGGISHVGLYLGNNYFVHSSVHGGVTISSLNDEYYHKKFISGGRITSSPKIGI